MNNQATTNPESSADSQCAMILGHLKGGRSITPIEALSQYGCFRLGARIYDLKEAGHKIDKEMVTDELSGKRFASYSYAADQEKANA